MTDVLYGHNNEQGIVALAQKDNRFVRLFKKNNGKIIIDDVEFFPFFFLTNPIYLQDFPKQYTLKELNATHTFRYIALFSRWNDLLEALQFILKKYNSLNNEHISNIYSLPVVHFINDYLTQFLLQSGITLYKGLSYEQLSITFFDIQWNQTLISKKYKKGNKYIRCITAINNNGVVFQASTLRLSDKMVILKFIEFIIKNDPDILITQNANFTFSQLMKLMAINNIDYNFSRDIRNTTVDKQAYSAHFDNDNDTFFSPGRSIVDFNELIEASDYSKWLYKDYSLTSVATAYNIPFNYNEINITTQNKLWKTEPKQILFYSKAKTEVIKDITNKLLPIYIHITQRAPLTLKRVLHTPKAFIIESILLREYIKQQHSIPKSSGSQLPYFSITEIFRAGVYKNIIHCVLIPLFHTAGKDLEIISQIDELNMLSNLRKDILADTTHHSQNIITANYKLLNAIPLVTITPNALFNDKKSGEQFLLNLYQLLYKTIKMIESFNVKVIQSESDTLFISIPSEFKEQSEVLQLLKDINNVLPSPLQLVFLQRYDAMFSHKKRSYVLRRLDGKILTNSNQLFPKTSELFYQKFTLECIQCLFEKNYEKMHKLYLEYYYNIIQHRWHPNDFCRLEYAQFSTNEYRELKKNPFFQPNPAMEAVLRSEKNIEKGEPIFYYIATSNQSSHIYELTSLAEEWSPLSPDENTHYYLTRLNETVQRFKDIFDPNAYQIIFGTDELFEFQLPPQPLREIIYKKPIQQISTVNDNFGIWIDIS